MILTPIEIESAKLRLGFRKAVKALFKTSINFKVQVTEDEAKEALKALDHQPAANIDRIITNIEHIAKCLDTSKINPYVEFAIGMEYSLVIYARMKIDAPDTAIDQALTNLSVMYSADEYSLTRLTPVSSLTARFWWD
jgi:hypothetical protein